MADSLEHSSCSFNSFLSHVSLCDTIEKISGIQKFPLNILGDPLFDISLSIIIFI